MKLGNCFKMTGRYDNTLEQTALSIEHDRNWFINWAMGRGMTYKQALQKYKEMMTKDERRKRR